MDVRRRTPHRLSSGPNSYTSLATSADRRRLALTLANPKRTLWSLQISNSTPGNSEPSPISLATNAGFFPRLGPNFLLYVSSTGTSESIWKFANGTGMELWSAREAHVLGAPGISPDGSSIAFSVLQNGQSKLLLMRSDGTNLRTVADSLDLQGSPAWAQDGKSITSAADDHGAPHLFRVPLDGQPPVAWVKEYSVEPTWAPDGSFVIFSGPDVGTTFPVKAAGDPRATHQVPALTLTRGARHLVFVSGGQAIVFLRGDIQHKDLWIVDLKTGEQRQLVKLPPDFDIRDFDISADGRQVVLERVQERSDIVLLDLPRK